MKIKPVVFFILTSWSISLQGQVLGRPLAASYQGMGAYSLHHVDVFSFNSNQASLAQMKNAGAGVYGERRFLLEELSNYHLALAVPTRSGNFGLKANYFGSAVFNETQIGFAYARKLGNKIDVGVQFNYNGIKAAGYDKASAISFEAGTVFHLSEKLHTGFHVNNPVGGKFGKGHSEKLPSVYTAGFGYDASEKFFFSLEMVKEEEQEVTIVAGFQYKFIPQILLRTGISSATSSISFGLGISLRNLRFDVAASYHPQLGISPGLLLLYDFKHRED
ncbi:MAG TPA: hypothetical protein VFI06_08710 [Chitinophagaceae bacterium]|nr:hypothetical protein [Chitinophagaceae bacterium]